MKVRLEKDGRFVELVRFGRVVFCADETGTDNEQGFFDDAEAEAALQVKVDEYREGGWSEPEAALKAQQQAREASAAKAALSAKQLAQHQRLVRHPDPKAAFKELAGPLLADAPAQLVSLCARVVRLGDASEHGVTVYLNTGAEIDWAATISLFVSPDRRDNDTPDLEYAETQGPPLGDEEIEGEVTGDITWFMSENIYNYWFFTSAEPHRARMWNHDGGIKADDIVRSPTQALAARLNELSE